MNSPASVIVNRMTPVYISLGSIHPLPETAHRRGDQFTRDPDTPRGGARIGNKPYRGPGLHQGFDRAGHVVHPVWVSGHRLHSLCICARIEPKFSACPFDAGADSHQVIPSSRHCTVPDATLRGLQ